MSGLTYNADGDFSDGRTLAWCINEEPNTAVMFFPPALTPESSFIKTLDDDVDTFTSYKHEDGKVLATIVWEDATGQHTHRLQWDEPNEEEHVSEPVDEPLDERHCNAVITNIPNEIHLPTHRCLRNTYVSIQLPSDKRTVRELIQFIYDFYQSPVTREDVEDHDRDVPLDVCEAYRKIERGAKTVKWIDLMSDLVYFEGITTDGFLRLDKMHGFTHHE